MAPADCRAAEGTASAQSPPVAAAPSAPAKVEGNAEKSGQPETQQAGADPSFDAAGARRSYRALIRTEAEKNGLPPDIADAVAAIESGYDPAALGAAGEIGLMQVLPSTAAMLGFRGDLAELSRPDVNIRFGVAYLSQAWRLTGGDLCRSLMKYRAGHGEESMSPLSITYCGRARAQLAAMGSPFAEAAPVPFALVPPVAGIAPRLPRRGPAKNRTATVSRAFWAAEEARVKAISRRIEARWRKMAAR
ncbi:MAG: transglycosylase SLT domain-containing protein [Methylocapsa sp.]|nr:transglycosylase SLT domain-containing protein [Methylocapsa sp.]